jgi:organic hydroperoxide reductase OsmC/OhrA
MSTSRATSTNVIPAPRGPERSSRDQAGTQSACAKCFVANSVNFPVDCEPEIEVSG